MIPSIRSSALAALAFVCTATTASAQEVEQVLKDIWVATDKALFEVSYYKPEPTTPPDADELKSELIPVPGAVSSPRALAFETPQLGDGPERALVSVEGKVLLRVVESFAAGNPETSGLTVVNAVAVADDGTVLFSGFSKKKRVYELWALDWESKEVKLRATGTPQLLDAVYISAEDVPASLLTNGARVAGVLAATAKVIMWFPETDGGWMAEPSAEELNPDPLPISLGLKGKTQLSSVDLVRGTSVFMLALSDRRLLTTSGGAPASFAEVPKRCDSPSLLVRNARGGPSATVVVSDSCGQVVRYDFGASGTTVGSASAPETTLVAGVLALAVGEGNLVTCRPTEPLCELTSGFDAKLDTTETEQLLVRGFSDLCDPRVSGCTAPNAVVVNNVLHFNSLLPAAIRDKLYESGVTITIPPYMFGAGPGGRFGALIVETDDPFRAVQTTVELDIEELLGFELGTRSAGNSPPDSFVRGATPQTLALLNQDIAAYAPDVPELRTVRDFEATPVTTGSKNPLIGGLRGFSVVIYGLQHDLNYPQGPSRPRVRTGDGGIPSNDYVYYAPSAGDPPRTPQCRLQTGNQLFVPIDHPDRFFINLAACLFADQETLLGSILADDDFLDVRGSPLYSADQDRLISRLTLVKDKVIKALNATGPNTGSTDFQAVLTQLLSYRDAVIATRFQADSIVYKNELLARADAFKFVLMERAYPSLPLGGFPPP